MAKKAHYIREWRKHRGLTLEQLAERIGMTHQNLGKIERYKVPYSQPLLEHLAEALRTDPASLIARDPSSAEELWALFDELTAPERQQSIELIKVVRRGRAA